MPENKRRIRKTRRTKKIRRRRKTPLPQENITSRPEVRHQINALLFNFIIFILGSRKNSMVEAAGLSAKNPGDFSNFPKIMPKTVENLGK